MSNLPACLRPAVFERVAEGWSAEAIASCLAEQFGLEATASEVLAAEQQANNCRR